MIDVDAVTAFNDNYVWILKPRDDRRIAVVDPGQAAPVADYLERHDLELAHILLTHHHHDHVGGINALRDHGATIWGPDDDRIPGEFRRVGAGDRVALPELDLEFEVMSIPAHTRTHIAFHGHGMLFCGDTLFSIGCGRLFEGTPADMQAALDQIAALDDETRVYCGHEYTVSNCRFARQVEPDNEALKSRAAEAEQQRRDGQRTLPSRLGDEKAANPFMRTRVPEVVEAARQRQPGVSPGAETMGVIRAWKDSA